MAATDASSRPLYLRDCGRHRSLYPLAMRTSLLLVVLLLGSASSTTVITQVANLPPAAAPASELAPLVERYNLDRSALFRRYDAEYSPERYARLTKFYKDWQQDLASVAFDALGVEGRLDYTLLRTRLEYELRLLTREQQWVREASGLMPFASQVTDCSKPADVWKRSMRPKRRLRSTGWPRTSRPP